jgi:hypothetical protein
VGHVLSQTKYYNVTSIAGDSITVKDHDGNQKNLKKDELKTMASGSHHSREVGLNMAGLAELFETFSETIFTVSFH